MRYSPDYVNMDEDKVRVFWCAGAYLKFRSWTLNFLMEPMLSSLVLVIHS